MPIGCPRFLASTSPSEFRFMAATRTPSGSKSKSESRSKSKSKAKEPLAKRSDVASERRVVDGEVVAGEAAAAAQADTTKAARSGSAKGKAAKEKAAKAKSPKTKAGKGKSKKGKAAKAPKRAPLTARTADPMELYQLAVQSPELDAAFLARVFKKLTGREARHLREDFCGTGYLMAAWLARNKENTAEGFDIDPEPVSWGLTHNFDKIVDAAERCSFHLKDVREPSHKKPDIRTSPNFSWMILTERQTMLEYFRTVHADLVDGGVFVLDIYGGPEAMEEMEEVRKVSPGFTYVWDQKRYDPATGAYHCRIHFRFKDGTELRNVFDYHWRLWTLPEVLDILREAGFQRVESWWEGTDADGVSGNGVFRQNDKGENCPAWVTYIVAQK